MNRRFPIIDFDPGLFAHFFSEEVGALNAQLLSGGACNSNYLVESEGGECFVCRIYQRGDPEREKAVAEMVNDFVPSPEYLWVGDKVAVMKYIKGEHFEPSAALVREAGRLIGRLAQVKFEHCGQLLASGEVVAFDDWPSYKDGLLALLRDAKVREYLNEHDLSSLRTLLECHSGLLEFFDSGRSLVHGDFKPENILISEGKIAGVIDWEFSHVGSPYMNIGNMLRHLSPQWQRDLAAGLADESFSLPEDWVFRAAFIDLASHLEFLTSLRSEAFKLQCVKRIRELTKL